MAERRTLGTGVVFYKSYYDAVRELSDTDRLAMYEAILGFGFKRKVASLPPHLKPLLTLIMPTVTASQNRYAASVANGKKGGAPEGNQNARKNNQTNNQTNNPNTDIEIDTNTDMEIDAKSEGDNQEKLNNGFMQTEDEPSNQDSLKLGDCKGEKVELYESLPYEPMSKEEARRREHFISLLEKRH